MHRFIIAAMVVALFVPAVARSQQPYFQQEVKYVIRATLDEKNHMLSGKEEIAYTNNSPDTLKTLYLHLYPNAYRSKNSALIKDFSRRFNKTTMDLPEKYTGWLEISQVSIDGADATPRVDDTVAEIELPTPLAPGATMNIIMNFEEKIRQHVGRAGYQGDHYDMAQWYPKVTVYDENGWHPDKFETGEFYGEFGTYDVYLNIPDWYVIAATGVVQDGDPGWTLNSRDGRTRSRKSDQRKSVHFHAENVHDFAWNVDPTFIVEQAKFDDVDVYSIYRRGNKAWRDSTMAHSMRALAWLKRKVGDYPYPQVSVVDALLAGGMEYPMLVMDGSVDEGLVVHEIGHIYFYGILANNEREEAWLDEGFTTFQTAWYMIDHYGPYGSKRDWNLYQKISPQFTEEGNLRQRLFALERDNWQERVAGPAQDFQNDYYTMVYRKGALALFALKYVVGDDAFEQILRQYYSEWQFKHVNEQRFQSVAERVSGMDLNWFFETWIHTRKICDYAIADVTSRTSERGDAITTTVTIQRLGEMVMPIELEFTFNDGTVQTTRIDGRLRTIIRSFDWPEKPKKVALNPRNEIADIDLSNNFKPGRHNVGFRWYRNNWYPEYSNQYRTRPGLWYNDVDGARVGWHVWRSYARFYDRLHLAVHYGIDSHRVDFEVAVDKPIPVLGNRGNFHISGYKLEGRQDFTLRIEAFKRKTLIHPPTQHVSIGVNYHELTDTRYRKNPEQYQTGGVLAPFFTYEIDPQLDIASTNIRSALKLGQTWFGAQYDFSKAWLDASIRTRPRFTRLDVGFRLFMGWVGGSMPYQEKYQLAFGGPLAEDEFFWTRAPGAEPEELNYQVPGQGNLRGYFKGGFGVNQLLAMNLEFGHRVPLISSRPTRWLGEFKLYGFGDVGWTFDTDNPIGDSPRVQALVDDGILQATMADAGVGLTVHRTFPFYDLFLRFDVPFWVNQPQINAETKQTQYRWVASLQATF